MIPSSRHYRESIFIHYSYVTFYSCSFPHNNIYTYIMYIFRVSISMCKCSYDSILLYIYSIHGKVYRYCLDIELLLSNFQLSPSNFKNCYCPTLNCYCPIFNCHCLILKIVTVQLWTVTVQFSTVTVQPLLSRQWTVTVQFSTVTVYFSIVTVWTLIRFLTIFKVLKLYFNWDWSR